VIDGATFTAGSTVEGPAIVDETDTTIYVPPGTRASRDEYGNYVLTR
jgi:N-methylhydantoinase A